MALTIGHAHGILMLLMMGSMYADKRLNLMLSSCTGVYLILASPRSRTQR